MDEYLNPWYILAETGTRRRVIMMHYGNGDKPNTANRRWQKTENARKENAGQ